MERLTKQLKTQAQNRSTVVEYVEMNRVIVEVKPGGTIYGYERWIFQTSK